MAETLRETPCDCDQKAVATEGLGLFALAGISIIAVAIGAAAIVALALVKAVRRRRSSGKTG
jgi:hypothetical protein